MRKRSILAALLLATGCSNKQASIADSLSAPHGDPMVTISHGALQGSTDDNGIHRFLGIPYAADTSSANRWAPPQPVAAWDGIKRAQAFGDICAQPEPVPVGPWTLEFIAVGDMSEDCLSLNVWTPDTNKKLPVFVWIHGGGFSTGSSDVPIYAGHRLAQEDIVVVSINYRLGILGFLSHPELASENNHSGEYGMLDQVAALQWVRDNIAVFGGDPSNITIGGQSAGAAAVQLLMTSHLADGLYHRAAIQSGIGLNRLSPNMDDSLKQGEQFQASLGAPTLAEMRAMPAADIIAAASAFRLPEGGRARFSPSTGKNFGGTFRHSNLPLITGLTANENSAFRPLTDMDEAGYDAFMQRMFGDSAEAFKSAYAKDDLSPLARMHAVMRERGMAAMALALENLDNHANAYLFAHAPPGPEGFLSFHSGELPYMFGTLQEGERNYSEFDQQLADTMVDIWANFMKGTLKDWPLYDHADKQIMFFGLEGKTTQVGAVLSEEKLDMYRDFIANGGNVSMLAL